ncbi:hypothetical protein BH20ACT9_BH20ACT9_08920 [soil metagenome]
MLTVVAASLRDYWRRAQPYQALAYVVGALLVAVGLAHLLGFLILGGAWEGPVAWRKPFAFGVSFGLTTLTLGWIATFLRIPRRLGWLLFGALAVSNTSEVVWVSVQRARGVPSHFNTGTVLDTVLFTVAGGVAILVTIAVILAVTVLAFTRMDAHPDMALAIRVGLVGLITAQAVGGAMIANGLAVQEAGGTQLTTLPPHGIMKVPHAVGMHGIQLLPGLSWLLTFTPVDGHRRMRLVRLACAGYAGLVAVVVPQTFRGLAPWQLGVLTGLLLVVSLGALTSAFATGVGALRRPRRAVT